MPTTPLPVAEILAGVTDTLGRQARHHRAQAGAMRRTGATLAGHAPAVEALGGEAARVRLAALALLFLHRRKKPATPAEPALGVFAGRSGEGREPGVNRAGLPGTHRSMP